MSGWRLPDEMLSQEHHSYHHGHGKISHSGDHFIDLLARWCIAGQASGKKADSVRVTAEEIRAEAVAWQIDEAGYARVFGPRWRPGLVSAIAPSQLARCGEVDVEATFAFRRDGGSVALASLSLQHNGASQRAWPEAPADLYKGNGRVKHEQHRVHVGPFLAAPSRHRRIGVGLHPRSGALGGPSLQCRGAGGPARSPARTRGGLDRRRARTLVGSSRRFSEPRMRPGRSRCGLGRTPLPDSPSAAIVAVRYSCLATADRWAHRGGRGWRPPWARTGSGNASCRCRIRIGTGIAVATGKPSIRPCAAGAVPLSVTSAGSSWIPHAAWMPACVTGRAWQWEAFHGPVSVVTGDGAYAHAGPMPVAEAAAHGVDLLVVVLDNGGCQGTGGQRIPGGILWPDGLPLIRGPWDQIAKVLPEAVALAGVRGLVLTGSPG